LFFQMKYHLLTSILLFLIFTTVSFAQDDSEEEVNSAKTYTQEELQEEQQALNFEKFFMKAIQQKSIENYDKALESLAQCQQIFPENSAMLFEMAKNHFALKQYIEAHHYCELFLQKEASNFWVLELSREIFIKEQNYTAAIKVQKELYNQKASEAANLLRLYYYKKDMVSGQRLIKEIDKKNLYVSAYDFYDKFFNRHLKEKVISPTQKIILNQEKTIVELQTDFRKNNDFKALRTLLKQEYRTKQFESLFIDSTLGLSLYPTQALVYLYNGLALNSLNRPNEAIKILEEGVEFVFDDPKMSKRFYDALINSCVATKNVSKEKKYKKLVQKL